MGGTLRHHATADDDPSGSVRSGGKGTNGGPWSAATTSSSNGATSVTVAGVSASMIRATNSRQVVQETAQRSGIWFPWSPRYKLWWAVTVACTILTAFYETYMVAFGRGGRVTGPPAIVGYALISVFALDMAVNFNLAFYNEADEIVWNRRAIATNYWRTGMFAIDLLGVFPFYVVVVAMAGEIGHDSSLTQYLNLFRLVRLVRLYRVKQLYDILQYSTKVSFMTLTLSRNFAVALVWYVVCMLESSVCEREKEKVEKF